MSQTETVPAQITSLRGNTASGEITLRIWQGKDRTKRALKTLGIAWAMALVAVLIPLLHFVLVPLFLIAGPVVAWVIYGQERTLLGGKGDCPDCKALLRIAQAPVQWPRTALCEACGTENRITAQQQA